MGMSSNAKLCYGYNLGGPENGWWIAELNEDGDWSNVGGDPANLIHEAAVQYGLELEFGGSPDYTEYILSAHTEEVEWGARQVDSGILALDWNEARYDDWARLVQAVGSLGITPMNRPEWVPEYHPEADKDRVAVEPGWILASFYG